LIQEKKRESKGGEEIDIFFVFEEKKIMKEEATEERNKDKEKTDVVNVEIITSTCTVPGERKEEREEGDGDDDEKDEEKGEETKTYAPTPSMFYSMTYFETKTGYSVSMIDHDSRSMKLPTMQNIIIDALCGFNAALGCLLESSKNVMPPQLVPKKMTTKTNDFLDECERDEFDTQSSEEISADVDASTSERTLSIPRCISILNDSVLLCGDLSRSITKCSYFGKTDDTKIVESIRGLIELIVTILTTRTAIENNSLEIQKTTIDAITHAILFIIKIAWVAQKEVKSLITDEINKYIFAQFDINKKRCQTDNQRQNNCYPIIVTLLSPSSTTESIDIKSKMNTEVITEFYALSISVNKMWVNEHDIKKWDYCVVDDWSCLAFVGEVDGLIRMRCLDYIENDTMILLMALVISHHFEAIISECCRGEHTTISTNVLSAFSTCVAASASQIKDMQDGNALTLGIFARSTIKIASLVCAGCVADRYGWGTFGTESYDFTNQLNVDECNNYAAKPKFHCSFKADLKNLPAKCAPVTTPMITTTTILPQQIWMKGTSKHDAWCANMITVVDRAISLMCETASVVEKTIRLSKYSAEDLDILLLLSWITSRAMRSVIYTETIICGPDKEQEIRLRRLNKMTSILFVTTMTGFAKFIKVIHQQRQPQKSAKINETLPNTAHAKYNTKDDDELVWMTNMSEEIWYDKKLRPAKKSKKESFPNEWAKILAKRGFVFGLEAERRLHEHGVCMKHKFYTTDNNTEKATNNISTPDQKETQTTTTTTTTTTTAARAPTTELQRDTNPNSRELYWKEIKNKIFSKMYGSSYDSVVSQQQKCLATQTPPWTYFCMACNPGFSDAFFAIGNNKHETPSMPVQGYGLQQKLQQCGCSVDENDAVTFSLFLASEMCTCCWKRMHDGIATSDIALMMAKTCLDQMTLLNTSSSSSSSTTATTEGDFNPTILGLAAMMELSLEAGVMTRAIATTCNKCVITNIMKCIDETFKVLNIVLPKDGTTDSIISTFSGQLCTTLLGEKAGIKNEETKFEAEACTTSESPPALYYTGAITHKIVPITMFGTNDDYEFKWIKNFENIVGFNSGNLLRTRELNSGINVIREILKYDSFKDCTKGIVSWIALECGWASIAACLGVDVTLATKFEREMMESYSKQQQQQKLQNQKLDSIVTKPLPSMPKINVTPTIPINTSSSDTSPALLTSNTNPSISGNTTTTTTLSTLVITAANEPDIKMPQLIVINNQQTIPTSTSPQTMKQEKKKGWFSGLFSSNNTEPSIPIKVLQQINTNRDPELGDSDPINDNTTASPIVTTTTIDKSGSIGPSKCLKMTHNDVSKRILDQFDIISIIDSACNDILKFYGYACCWKQEQLSQKFSKDYTADVRNISESPYIIQSELLIELYKYCKRHDMTKFISTDLACSAALKSSHHAGTYGLSLLSILIEMMIQEKISESGSKGEGGDVKACMTEEEIKWLSKTIKNIFEYHDRSNIHALAIRLLMVSTMPIFFGVGAKLDVKYAFRRLGTFKLRTPIDGIGNAYDAPIAFREQQREIKNVVMKLSQIKQCNVYDSADICWALVCAMKQLSATRSREYIIAASDSIYERVFKNTDFFVVHIDEHDTNDISFVLARLKLFACYAFSLTTKYYTVTAQEIVDINAGIVCTAVNQNFAAIQAALKFFYDEYVKAGNKIISGSEEMCRLLVDVVTSACVAIGSAIECTMILANEIEKNVPSAKSKQNSHYRSVANNRFIDICLKNVNATCNIVDSLLTSEFICKRINFPTIKTIIMSICSTCFLPDEVKWILVNRIETRYASRNVRIIKQDLKLVIIAITTKLINIATISSQQQQKNITKENVKELREMHLKLMEWAKEEEEEREYEEHQTV
jgi:hypothetical protein